MRKSGFTALAALDSNADGVINSLDAEFSTLRVWRDLDKDGKTDAGELQTLTEAGITSISLTTTTPASSQLAGNPITAQSTVTFANGQTHVIADVILANNQADSVYLGDTTVSSAAASLPNLKGFGNVKNLDVAMTGDAALLALVDSFKDLPATTNWAAFKAAADDVLFRWAGVDGVSPVAMTGGFDRQKLAFLEAYTGNQLTPRDAQGVPSLVNVQELIDMWNDVIDRTTVRLAAQGPLEQVFGDLTLNLSFDAMVLPASTTLADIYKNAIQNLSSTPATALSEWNESWGPLLSESAGMLVRTNGVPVRSDFQVASLVRALSQISSPLSLVQLAAGLAIANIIVGTQGDDAMARGSAEGTQVFVGDAGNDTLTGGSNQDVYVFGSGFGQDTIVDVEAPGKESGDRIRFATLNAADVTISRSGVDLVIAVKNSTDTITIKNQFSEPLMTLFGQQLTPEYGIEEIQFADGTIYESGEIAAAIGLGTSGNDTIVGTALADELEGLEGDDLLQGGDGGDSYIFSAGDGNDTIQEVMTNPLLQGPDILFLLAGLSQSDLSYERNGDGDDLKILFPTATDSVVIKGQFEYNERGYQETFSTDKRIEVIFFEDGTGLNWIDIQKNVIAAYTTDGNDITYGFGTPDEFAASKGNDFLSGLDGGDIYHFGKGSGNDVVSEDARYTVAALTAWVGSGDDFNQNDSVVFDAGISLADVTFSRQGAAPDLTISIAGTSDTLTISDEFKGIKLDIFNLFGVMWADRVEEFRFADGTKLTWQQVLAITTHGTAANESLYGAYYADTMIGEGGNDYLSGLQEGDAYHFKIGDGQDIIEDRNQDPFSRSADSIVFGSGISVGDVTFSISGSGFDDFLVQINGTADQIVIKNHFDRYITVLGEIDADRIELFKWADGTEKTWQQLLTEHLASLQTSGADSIHGTDYNETFDGGAGNDLLQGDNGDDTYIFGRGYGQDTVSDYETDFFLSSIGDRVLFNADTAAADVDVFRTSGEGIALSIRGTSDIITISGAYNYTVFGPKPYEIEFAEFSDGSKWSADVLRAKAMESQVTAGDDIVRGFYSSDIVTGGAGNDILQGGDGSDIYRFNAGDGNDTITEITQQVNYPSNDTIELGAGFTASNIVLSKAVGSDDLLISFTGSTDTLTVTDQFKATDIFKSRSWTSIQTIKFADGTAWSEKDIREKLLEQQKTSGNDIIEGFFNDDILDGGAGNDILRGGYGNDTYLFGIGHGQDEIEETAYTASNRTDKVQFLEVCSNFAWPAQVESLPKLNFPLTNR